MTTTEPTTKAGRRVGRRALLATTGLGVCAVGAGLVVTKGPGLAEQQLQQVLRNEVGTLEGIELSEAIRVAELTQRAVQVIVVPIARLETAIGAGGLGVLIGVLQRAQQALAFFHQSITVLSLLIATLQTWQSGMRTLPIALNVYATTDTTKAITYLRALQARLSQPGGAPL